MIRAAMLLKAEGLIDGRQGEGVYVATPLPRCTSVLHGDELIRGCLGGVWNSGGMDNRFRRLPPRIEPRYETHDVSDPPPLPEVRETSWLTPAGEVAGFERLASAVARNSDRTGSNTVRQRRRGRVLVILYIALALGTAAVGFVLNAHLH